MFYNIFAAKTIKNGPHCSQLMLKGQEGVVTINSSPHPRLNRVVSTGTEIHAGIHRNSAQKVWYK